jgi:hypothetical protein
MNGFYRRPRTQLGGFCKKHIAIGNSSRIPAPLFHAPRPVLSVSCE